MANGVPEDDVVISTDALIDTDKKGIDSHGANRLKPTTAVIDAHDGMGQVASHHSMRLAIEKAKEYGMGMVAVRNSTHYGTAEYYTEMAADVGCIGMSGTNADHPLRQSLVLKINWKLIPYPLHYQRVKISISLLMQRPQLFKEEKLNYLKEREKIHPKARLSAVKAKR